jgi:hypothetical protein
VAIIEVLRLPKVVLVRTTCIEITYRIAIKIRSLIITSPNMLIVITAVVCVIITSSVTLHVTSSLPECFLAIIIVRVHCHIQK